MGGSAEITTGAYDLMNGTEDAGNDARDVARHMIDSINSQPIKSTRLYSGHVLDSKPEVGDVIDVPLMAVAHARGLAEAYAGAFSDSKAPNPAMDPKKNDALSVLRVIHETMNPGVPKTDREIWDEGDPNIKQMVTRRYKAIGPNTYRPTRTVYEFQTSRSANVTKGLERATSGRYRVTEVRQEPIKGTWLYDTTKADFVPEMVTRVKLEYVEPISIQS